MSINTVIIIGNVGQDPNIKKLSEDSKVANFSVATSETYTDKQGSKVTVTEWHNIVLWNKLATVAEKWIKKGQQIYISGKLKTRSYESQDDQKHYVTEIFGSTIQMLGKKPENNQNEEHHE
jgi:single-strand DNA-binding protein